MNLLGLLKLRRNNGKVTQVSAKASRCHLASPRRRERIFPWQVFGLCRFIPTRRTSQNPQVPVSSWAFVSAYRCGAVPDFHRVPFSFSRWRNRGRPPYMGPASNARLLIVENASPYPSRSTRPQPELLMDCPCLCSCSYRRACSDRSQSSRDNPHRHHRETYREHILSHRHHPIHTPQPLRESPSHKIPAERSHQNPEQRQDHRLHPRPIQTPQQQSLLPGHQISVAPHQKFRSNSVRSLWQLIHNQLRHRQYRKHNRNRKLSRPRSPRPVHRKSPIVGEPAHHGHRRHRPKPGHRPEQRNRHQPNEHLHRHPCPPTNVAIEGLYQDDQRVQRSRPGEVQSLSGMCRPTAPRHHANYRLMHTKNHVYLGIFADLLGLRPSETTRTAENLPVFLLHFTARILASFPLSPLDSSACAIHPAITFISASFIPRVVKAGVPIRIPLGFIGGLTS